MNPQDVGVNLPMHCVVGKSWGNQHRYHRGAEGRSPKDEVKHGHPLAPKLEEWHNGVQSTMYTVLHWEDLAPSLCSMLQS